MNKRKLKDRSSLSKSGYILFHIFFGVCYGVCCYIFLPFLISDSNYLNQSFLNLTVCLLVTSLYGIIFTFEYNRSLRGCAVDTIAGLGAYVALALGNQVSFLKYLVVGAGIITIICFAYILSPKINDSRKKNQIIFIRILKLTQVIRWNLALVSLGILFFTVLVPLPVKIKEFVEGPKAFEIKFSSSNQKLDNSIFTVHEVYGDEFKLANNIDKIKLIRDNATFQKLSLLEKKEVCTAILRCEGRILGLEEFQIVFTNDFPDYRLGSFNNTQRTIYINENPLRDGSLIGGSNEEVLSTLLHECRHYYQYLIMELYEKATPEQRNLLAFTSEGVSSWVKNAENYYSVEDQEDSKQFKQYLDQALEQDARQYEYEHSTEYFRQIDSMLLKEKKGDS